MPHLQKKIRYISKQSHFCHWCLAAQMWQCCLAFHGKIIASVRATLPLCKGDGILNMRFIGLIWSKKDHGKCSLLSKQVQLNQTVQALSQLRVSPQTEMFANSPGQHRVFIFWENPATSPEGICDWAWLRLPSSIVCEKIHCLDKILGEVFSILH